MHALHAGILFTRISLDAFDGVLAGALADLDDLLSRAPVSRGAPAAANGAAAHGGAGNPQCAILAPFTSSLSPLGDAHVGAPPRHLESYSSTPRALL